ncbi:hypothetical protein V1264_011772 [Littorina saxatilis]|uniref:Uncharacterized protein n=1 Tax=Littorina saxatilis TaxID=31220 RepID=A0AAN9BZP8_9CAEN
MAQEEFDRWVGVDDGASIVEPTDENNETIMQNIVTSLRPGTSLDETETETEPESDDEEEPPPPTAPEMRALMKKLRSGLQSRGYNMEKFEAFDNEVKDLLWSSTNTQTNIRDFFQALSEHLDVYMPFLPFTFHSISISFQRTSSIMATMYSTHI